MYPKKVFWKQVQHNKNQMTKTKKKYILKRIKKIKLEKFRKKALKKNTKI